MTTMTHEPIARAAPGAPRDTAMFREAHEADVAVARQLERNDAAMTRLAEILRRDPPRFVVTCARGSSDHAATYAKYVFETELGFVTASASPSVTAVYEAPQRLEGALYLVISQSGRSPDLVENAERARRAGARVVAFVNAEDSPLAARAEHVVPLAAGPELSVAATKSYICSLSAILHLAARWRDDARLIEALFAAPEAMRASWSYDWSPALAPLAGARNLFVVARGLGLAVAQEAALKLKETCGLHAEAFSAAEVRHGPMTLVGPDFPVLFFAQHDATADGTLALAREFRARGATVWIASGDQELPGALPLADTAHPACTPLVAIRNFYRAANALALARGRNPDLPPHLKKVTETR